jgi:hypothetical protein
LRACWIIQELSGSLVQATYFDPARPDRDDEQLQPPQPNGIDGEQVTGEDLPRESQDQLPHLLVDRVDLAACADTSSGGRRSAGASAAASQA